MQSIRPLLVILLLTILSKLSQAQTFSSEFLDGRIMFQLKIDTHNYVAKQIDPNDFSLEVSPNDYPFIKQIFQSVHLTKMEKPSFFTGKPELQNIFRISFDEYDKIDELVAALKKTPGVVFAEKEPIYKIDFVPNDTYHTGNNKWYHTLVGSESAWNISQGSTTVKIAIIDNAVFCGHADLTTYSQYDVADNDANASPPLTSSADFGWSHGTHCAGLATADINNATGIASLGGNVQLMGVKATPNSASSSLSVWYSYAGIQWACANGANVVSMSFGGTSSSTALQTLINAYPNVVFLAAAGNDAVTTLVYPGAYNNVICVGSVDANDTRSSFSNYNGSTPFVDIAAPGGYSFGGLYSTVYTSNGNGYDQMGGTSMATPFAAGLVGLMLSLNPTLTPQAVLNCLISSGVAINQSIGPRINAPAALACVQATLTGDPIPYFSGTPLNIIEGDSVIFSNLSANGGSAITSYNWSFPGGNPSTFSGANPPPVFYSTAGIYNVSLTATNAQSTQTFTQTNYVNVSIPPYGEWLIQNTGFPQASRGINHISIVDPNIIWATAYDGTAAAANVQQFTKTTNGGLTWTPGTINVNNTGLGIAMIHAESATKAWLAAFPNAAGQTGGIWVTTNGGSTWTRQNTASFSNAASFTNAVYFWNEQEGVCMGDPINNEFEIYRTTNGGTNWTLVSGANIPNPQANEFGYTRQMEVVGDNVWFTTSKGRIYHSTNRGQNWSVYTSPVADFGGAVTTGVSANLSFSSSTTGLIINQAGNIWKSTNSGSTWAAVTPSGPVYTNGLCFIEGTNTAFTTGAATGASGSSYSTDGGITWNPIDTEQHLYVDFINPSVGWSGWFNTSSTADGMWKWNDLTSAFVPDFESNTLTTCVNSAISLTDLTTGATPTSWSWSFPGGTPATSTLQNPTVLYAAAGVYDITLTVSNGSSQTTLTEPGYITVVNPAAVPSAITGLGSVCDSTQQTYSVTAVSEVIYNWSIPAGWSGSSSSNAINVMANTTSGLVSVNAENVCGTSPESSLYVDVMPGAPTAFFSISSNNGSTSFNGSVSANASSWLWDFGDGESSTQSNPVHNYLSNGSFDVTLIVENGCGSDTLTQSVEISGVGLDEKIPRLVKVLTNPVEGELCIINDSDADELGLFIYDVSGRLLMEENVEGKQSNIDISEWSSGSYYIHLVQYPNIILKFTKI
jgi:PKD repeat protein